MSAEYAAEYEFNLANLIRDVRIRLRVPDLPVSIGVSGMSGWESHDPDRSIIIAAQFAVSNATLYPEFAGTVASVETRNFFRPPEPSSPGSQIYHWNNNCESYWLIGKAMGEAMINLIRNKKVDSGNRNKINDNGNGSSDRIEVKLLRGTSTTAENNKNKKNKRKRNKNNNSNN